MHDQRIDGDDQRKPDENQRAHPDEFRAFRFQECLAVGRRKPIDDIAEELKQRHFADGDQHGAERHDQQPGRSRPRIVPAERKEPLRRSSRLCRWIGIEAGFKPAEHV